MGRVIEKKVLSEYFEKILSGQKTFEVRLADWECQPGDTLVLNEIDDETKKPTGRNIRRQVGYIIKTKELNLFSQSEVDEYGYQVISLLNEEEV